MQIYLTDENTKITPFDLVGQAKVWNDLYKQAIGTHDAIRIAAGLYCLLSAVEMYLKAYIVLKDVSFANPNKLRSSLSHNFRHMFNEVSRLAPQDFSDSIQKTLDKYQLMDLNIAAIKYPEDRRMIGIDYGLDKGEHSFDEIFEQIEIEVRTNRDSWLEEAYPKESSIVTMLTVESEFDSTTVTKEQVEEWFAMCPSCRPTGVIMHLWTSYPWSRNPDLLTCTECGALYNSDRMT